MDTVATAAPVADGVVLIDGNFRPLALDLGAQAIFDSLSGHKNGTAHLVVPRLILDLLESRSSHNDDGNPMCVAAGGHSYSCRTFTLNGRNGAEPLLTLYLRREPSLVDMVHQLAVDYRLTDREEEAIVGLAMGLSSKELAVTMKISPNTVKAFVRLAMIKMGASSRARLVAKLLDRQMF